MIAGMIENQNPRALGHARLMAFAVAFFIVTSFTIYWTRFSGGLALVWFGTAILSALLVHTHKAAWFRVLLIFAILSTVSTSIFGFGPKPAIPLAILNITEATLVAGLLIHFRPQRDYLESWQGFIWLTVSAGIVGPALAALPGGWLVHLIDGRPWVVNSGEWFLAHGLGTMLACPLAILFARGSITNLMKVATNRGHLELAVLSLANVLVALVAFYQSNYPLLFLPILPLTFACFRLGRIGAAVSVLLIAVMALGAFISGAGPFANLPVSLAHKAMFLQFYLAAILLFSLPVATALKNYEMLRLRFFKRAALQRLISDHSDDALLTLDREGRIRYASPASFRICDESDLQGQHFSLFFNDDDRPLVDSTLSSASGAPEQTQVLERCVIKENGSIWLEAKIRSISQHESTLESYVVSIRDVTTRKNEYIFNNKEAGIDHLTGLPNRRAFLAILEARLAKAEKNPCSVGIFDFDEFDKVNEKFGQHIGDMALKHFGRMLMRAASPDCFFARVGGQEFAMVCQNTSWDQSREICERLRQELADQKIRNADDSFFAISVSIGLIHISEPCSASDALEAAYDSLHSAKQAGRNNVHSLHGANGWNCRVVDRERHAIKAQDRHKFDYLNNTKLSRESLRVPADR